MSERNEENDEADREANRARADLRYLARTSPPIPDALMQEAHRLIEADGENPKDPVPPSRTNWPDDMCALLTVVDRLWNRARHTTPKYR